MLLTGYRSIGAESAAHFRRRSGRAGTAEASEASQALIARHMPMCSSTTSRRTGMSAGHRLGVRIVTRSPTAAPRRCMCVYVIEVVYSGFVAWQPIGWPNDCWLAGRPGTDCSASSKCLRGEARRMFAFALVRVVQCARAWLSSTERPRSRPSMIDQNREHLMGSLAGHCRPCSSAVRATSIRCCCSASSANL